MSDVPALAVDFYGDAVIRDPLPVYAALRALGPVVYLPSLGNFAAVRFDAVREALHKPQLFRSGEGVAADEVGCTFLRGNTLASDGAQHDLMRRTIGAPLLPGALAKHRPWIEEVAERLIEGLCAKHSFDGMADLARHLPLTVVTHLIGLPDDGRENMLSWAAASFDILGIQNERGRCGMERIKEMRHWIATRATADRLRAGSWTARILALSEAGEIPEAIAPQLIRDYINPSLDTTISASGELLLQLARAPDQWERIRSEPKLIPRAVEEAVRLATPIRSFTRHVAEDCVLAGVPLPKGARLMLVFASANRDELHFDRPDRFDVERRERDHVGFGQGHHMCVGMHLARLEMTALLRAMAKRVRRIHAGMPQISLNNTIRSYSRLPLAFEAL